MDFTETGRMWRGFVSGWGSHGWILRTSYELLDAKVGRKFVG